MLDFLDPNDYSTEQFLIEYFDPSILGFDNAIDAVEYLQRLYEIGMVIVFGRLDWQSALVCLQRSNKVIEPHLAGNSRCVRYAIKYGLPIARDLGYERVIFWVTNVRLAELLRRAGFDYYGVIPRLHEKDGELLDVHVLGDDLVCNTLIH